MDDIVIRSRYPRHSVSGKKKKRYAGEKNGLNTIIARQVFVSVLILTVAFAAKYVDTPVAEGIKDKIQYMLTSDINLKNAMASINEYLGQMWNKSLTDGNTGKSSKITDGSAKNTDLSDQTGNSTEPEATAVNASLNDAGVNGVVGSDGSIVMMTVPVKGILSSAFGERTDSVTGIKKVHEGIDIEAEKGEKIKAALGGTVVESRNSKSYGKYVKIRHQGELVTVYAHCSLINVTEGQEVKQGETIAEVGNTGASLGNHLHFEIWKNGKAVNPLDYVSIDKE